MQEPGFEKEKDTWNKKADIALPFLLFFFWMGP